MSLEKNAQSPVANLFQSAKILYDLDIEPSFSFVYTEKDQKQGKSIIVFSKDGKCVLMRRKELEKISAKTFDFQISDVSQIKNEIFGIISTEKKVFVINAFDEDITPKEITGIPNAKFVLKRFNEKGDFLIISEKCGAFLITQSLEVKTAIEEFSEVEPTDARILCRHTKIVIAVGKNVYYSSINEAAKPLCCETPFTIRKLQKNNQKSFIAFTEEKNVPQLFTFQDDGTLAFSDVGKIANIDHNNIIDTTYVSDNTIAYISEHIVFMYKIGSERLAKATTMSKFTLKNMRTLPDAQTFVIGTENGTIVIAKISAKNSSNRTEIDTNYLYNFHESEIENILVLNNDAFITLSKNGRVLLWENEYPWWKVASTKSLYVNECTK